VLVVLIKIELYYFLAFLTIYGAVEVHFTVPEFPLLVCLVPLALLQAAFGIYFTKTENRLGAIVMIVSITMRHLNGLKSNRYQQVLRLAEIAYLVSRIVYMKNMERNHLITMGNEMMLFAGAALAFTTLICINFMVCMFNFGYGLKPLLLLGDKDQKQEYEFQPLGHRSGHQSFVSTRFDLD